MCEAGFKEQKMEIGRSEAWTKTKDLRRWVELTWAYLGGIGSWQESDKERWDEAVKLMEVKLREAEGTSIVDDEVWMRASQWVVAVM
ncbi:hypothetical protein K469DRAFT_699845, partial [Zopfia rhizophila CBS 207.26]